MQLAVPLHRLKLRSNSAPLGGETSSLTDINSQIIQSTSRRAGIANRAAMLDFQPQSAFDVYN